MNLKQYFNGKLVDGEGKETNVINPATGKVAVSFPSISIEQTEEALQSAEKAFETWSYTSLNERIAYVQKIREKSIEKKEEIIELQVIEGGKTQGDAAGEFNRFIAYLDFYVEECKRTYGVGLPDYAGHRDTANIVVMRPLGVVVSHLAWNVPLTNIGVKMIPAMLAGCTCIMKPSSETPLSAMMLGEICAEIGLPAGVVNIISGPSSVIGKYLNESKIPSMLTVIGSTETGRQIMEQGSTSIKKYSMELGGNAPAIILDDVDIDYVVKNVLAKKKAVSGQSCAGMNRIFVHENIHDLFIEKLTEAVRSIPYAIGKEEPANCMGPLMTVHARDELLDLVGKTVEAGAELVYGGKVPDGLPEEYKDGAWMELTILDHCTDDMPNANREVFGPIFSIYTFSDLDDVIRRANNTSFGLSAYAFTHDARAIMKIGERINAGEIYINELSRGVNIPHIGLKQSGVGCIYGKWSLEEFYCHKRITVRG